MVDGVCLNAGNRDGGAAVPSHIAIESGDGGSVIAPWDPQVAEDALAIANLNTDLREFIFRVSTFLDWKSLTSTARVRE